MGFKESELEEFVTKLDDLIEQYPDAGPQNIAGVLLSRVTLLMTMDPAVGKSLVRYVWERLDEIEQGDPGGMI